MKRSGGRPGVVFVGELRPGEDWRVLPDGRVVIVSAERPPEVIRPGRRRKRVLGGYLAPDKVRRE